MLSSNFNYVDIIISWAFSFLEIKIKFSPSIFQCIIFILESQVSNWFSFSIQELKIYFELGASIVLIILYELIFIDIFLNSGIINKSFDIIIKDSQ